VGGDTCGRGEGERSRLRWEHMADGLHILMWNQKKKLLAIAFSAAWKVSRGREGVGDLKNTQY
jgi:hypothetical protein